MFPNVFLAKKTSSQIHQKKSLCLVGNLFPFPWGQPWPTTGLKDSLSAKRQATSSTSWGMNLNVFTHKTWFYFFDHLEYFDNI